MSQRAEKYARNMEKRVNKLEEWANFTRGELQTCGRQLEEIKEKNEHQWAAYANEVGLRAHGEIQIGREIRRNRREIERDMARQRRGMLLTLALAVAALIVAAMAMGIEREKAQRAVMPVAEVHIEQPRSAEDSAAKPLPTPTPVLYNPDVPLQPDLQLALYESCEKNEVPVALALAVADWETRGQFNMDAVGPAGEVGIFQLNPGPDGAYHAELEAATGLDPTTPEGNIAGGCYKLGKYLAEYGDAAMVAMAYNMGQAGARAAWEAGITSNDYTDAVLEAMERWECAVNAWAGE